MLRMFCKNRKVLSGCPDVSSQSSLRRKILDLSLPDQLCTWDESTLPISMLSVWKGESKNRALLIVTRPGHHPAETRREKDVGRILYSKEPNRLESFAPVSRPAFTQCRVGSLLGR